MSVVSFLAGANYPWTVVNGKPNFGCDFGTNVWGSWSGVSRHADVVLTDFRSMASAGVAVARWFVFTDGRGGVAWDERGRLTGLAPHTLDDLDAALEIARQTGVRLCLVLFDFHWMVRMEARAPDGTRLWSTQPGWLAEPEGQAQVFKSLIDPLLDRYGPGGPCADLGRAIHSFDVINEPDWVTRGLECDWRRVPGERRFRVPRPFGLGELRALARGVADRVHARSDALVTLGGGRARFALEWDDPAYGLDVIQLHLYPDVRRPRRDRAVFPGRWKSLDVAKPVLIGEFPANGDRQHPPDHRPPPATLVDYVAHARDAGYLGAWPWSFKGIDEFGPVDPAAFHAAHSSR